MMKFVGVLVLATLSLSAKEPTYTSDDVVSTSDPQLEMEINNTWELMIGTWYGSQRTRDGGHQQWIIDRRSNGTYEVTYRLLEPSGFVLEAGEFGLWGVSGNLYITVIQGIRFGSEEQTIEDEFAFTRNAYKIISLTESKFVYHQELTDNKFTVIKVEDGFTFPEG